MCSDAAEKQIRKYNAKNRAMIELDEGLLDVSGNLKELNACNLVTDFSF